MKRFYCMRTMISDEHVDALEARLGNAPETISVWLIDNKLSLHLGKTESILFLGRNENFKTVDI